VYIIINKVKYIKMRIDYHTHTKLSGDNTQTIDELCLSAIEKEIEEICITEHIDFNPGDTCYGHFNWESHLKNIEYAKSKYNLSVKYGAEIDYQPQYYDNIKEIISSCDFDYIMGSAHYVDDVIVFNHDDYFINKDMFTAYNRYFETELEIIKTGFFDGVSHFDLIKRWGSRFYGSFQPELFEGIITECLKEIIQRDMTLEINSSGIRQDPKEFYPHPYIVRLYKKLGGENITFGSDSHNKNQTGYNIDHIYKFLKEEGFKQLTTYSKRKKICVEI